MKPLMCPTSPSFLQSGGTLPKRGCGRETCGFSDVSIDRTATALVEHVLPL
uniref:Uncharacterized protein n=1 Tax=Anguilla anguilla TaxID=7936 RepID=A0A0E9TFH3_ANGAN